MPSVSGLDFGVKGLGLTRIYRDFPGFIRMYAEDLLQAIEGFKGS